jgi:hypothetical protein
MALFEADGEALQNLIRSLGNVEGELDYLWQLLYHSFGLFDSSFNSPEKLYIEGQFDALHQTLREAGDRTNQIQAAMQTLLIRIQEAEQVQF